MLERHIPFRTTATACLLAALAAAGCGGGGGGNSGSSSQDPHIKGVAVAVRPTDRVFAFGADCFDAQGDLFGGTLILDVDPPVAGHFEFPLNTLLPGANPTDPEGDAFGLLRLNPRVPRGLGFTWRITVVDSKGHRSNTVGGTAVTETTMASTAPIPEGPLFEGGEAGLGKPRL